MSDTAHRTRPGNSSGPASSVRSATAAPTLTVTEFGRAMEVVAGIIERFAAAWDESDAAPDIAPFLPAPGDPDRRFALIELIKMDLEFRWRERNLPKRLDEYLAEFPELTEGGVPTDLIYEEYHVRRNSGLRVDPREYLQRFPERAPELRGLLGLTQSFSTTSFARRQPRKALEGLVAGAVLDDFDLLTELGRGAFARVFLARQRSMQRLVALKVSADSGNEPQTLAQFDHEHIVRVYDQRVDPQRSVRLLYMQYLPGGTLHSIVDAVRKTPPERRTGRLLLETVRRNLDDRGEARSPESSVAAAFETMTWPQAVCWIGARLAQALDYAHRNGVLHRDVKPANVLLSADGVPKLADFNVSFCSKVSGATPAAYFGGSLGYMSPEQLDACNPADACSPDSLDGRSDLYSLGVVLWELLTGRRPFEDDEPRQGWFQMLSDLAQRRRSGLDEAALAQLPPNSPPGLAAVLQRTLDPDPNRRWPDGLTLARQLDLCRDPALQEYLHPEPRGLRARLAPWYVGLVGVMTMAPNMLAGAFNYVYNRNEIMRHLSPESLAAFDRIQAIINAIAFPLGLLLVTLLAAPASAAARRAARGEPCDPDLLRDARRRCLRIGSLAAIIGVIEWAVAGIAYPLSIDFAGGHLPPLAYVHFAGSLLLCGLVAAAYPFFGITSLGLRVLYPRLLGPDLEAAGDRPLIARLRRQSGFYLALAVLVPLLSVLALAGMGSDSRFALIALSLTGLFGFGIVLKCFNLIHRTLATLEAGLVGNSG